MSQSSAPRRAPAVLLALFAAATLLAGAILAARARSPQPQKPAPFRTGVNFVRVDVYPTGTDGRHVGDLRAADFEVLENGVPQKIETFEHVVIDTGSVSPAERVEPDSTRTEKQAAADARSRLFVIFLDTGNVSDPMAAFDGVPGDGVTPPPAGRVGPPMPIAAALTTFLEKTIGRDDLVALMTPDMDARDIVFVRRPSSIEEFVRSAWAKGNAPGRAGADEQRLQICGFRGEFGERLMARRREEQAIRAARDLVAHLRTLREERKAVLLVSEGWMLYKPDQSLLGKLPPAPKGVYVGPDGKPHVGVDSRESTYDQNECGREAFRLSQIDDEKSFRDLLDEANRANTSFYPVHPRGLPALNVLPGQVPRGRDLGLDQARDTMAAMGLRGDFWVGSAIVDTAALRVRLETMQTLADATDGLTLLSNDLDRVLQRIADDTSAYYLLGYSSTNTKADGSFRRISVRVGRPGVTVRARRGYRAATPEELAASRAAPPAEDPALEPVRNAIAGMAVSADRVPFVAEAGRGCASPAAGSVPVAMLWVAGELTSSGSRDAEWKSGAAIEISVADATGRGGAAVSAQVSPAQRSFLVAVSTPATGDEYNVRVVATPSDGSALPMKQALRLRAEPRTGDGAPCVGSPALARRGPFTGNAFQPTADSRFRRQERVRIEVPVTGSVERVAVQLLDRDGKPIALPVNAAERQDSSGRWVGGELPLAPLAAGDYVVQIELASGGTRQKVLRAIRVVP